MFRKTVFKLSTVIAGRTTDMAQKQFGKVIDIFITHTPGDLCL
ncbi:hypothetical protein AB89_1074 [Escherichia coli 2-316-03_S3_C1]|nr:hypothetical protein AB89_1074 [Escherichia coli 2-316-03_S3_C1]